MDSLIHSMTYVGPRFPDDSANEIPLPDDLTAILKTVNGFVLAGGALHVRGLCLEPDWHALGTVLHGGRAVHRLFPAVTPADIPFGQDCVGDQFILRQGLVWILRAETGDLEPLEVPLSGFLEMVAREPDAALGTQPLRAFEKSGGTLVPGYVLHAYPPFCTKEAASGVSLRSVPSLEALEAHAAFASAIAHVSDGTSMVLDVQQGD